MNLKREFNNFYKTNFGKLPLSSPILYNFPFVLRLEIGPNDIHDINNYKEEAFKRAIYIFNELFDSNDLIYIVVYNQNKSFLKENYNNKNICVIRSLLSGILDECQLGFDKGCGRYLIKTVARSLNITKLINKIVCSELENSNQLSSSIYLFNKRSGIMYYLYDDRGLDVAMNNQENIDKIYKKYKNWILN